MARLVCVLMKSIFSNHMAIPADYQINGCFHLESGNQPQRKQQTSTKLKRVHCQATQQLCRHGRKHESSELQGTEVLVVRLLRNMCYLAVTCAVIGIRRLPLDEKETGWRTQSRLSTTACLVRKGVCPETALPAQSHS